ncbi:MAG: hypothetical protein IPJ78_18265 [Gemmatimonadetes bacterium]|nr:hypothetical protein [Gemmatimonadota bacterium]
MEKLLVMIVSTVGSAIGWWLGARVGIMTAFMVSIVGLALGVWGGRRLARHWSI